MPSTAVGLFTNGSVVDRVIKEIETLGFARNEVRRLNEPDSFEITGVMSFPRLDFETALERRLKTIGATETQTQAFLQGLRGGGTVLFATDPDEQKVRTAEDVMNKNGAAALEEGSGPEPTLPRVETEPQFFREGRTIAGRVNQSPQPGTIYFSW